MPRIRPALLPAAAVALVLIVGCVASSAAHLMAVAATVRVPADPRDAVRHGLEAGCLGVLVVALRAQLRAARRPAAATVVSWLVCTLPVATQAGLTANRLAHPAPDTGWLLLASPGLVAALALALIRGRFAGEPVGLVGLVGLVGPVGLGAPATRRSRRAERRGRLRRRTAAGVVLALPLAWGSMVAARNGLGGALTGAWPGSAGSAVSAVSAGEAMTLAAALGGMVTTAGLLATSGVRLRWVHAVVTAVPGAGVAAVPTLVAEPTALVTAQRWTVVTYPLLCLAAAAAAVVVTGAVQLGLAGLRATRSTAPGRRTDGPRGLPGPSSDPTASSRPADWGTTAVRYWFPAPITPSHRGRGHPAPTAGTTITGRRRRSGG